jgi:murein DD-endopeptidase MepM/ murein hydrolase activator NlpD
VAWCLVLAAGLLLLLAPAGTAAAAGGWVWPLDPEPVVLAGFVAPAGPFAAGHRGVDLAATVGQPVLAPGGGTVAFAGSVAGKPVVSIDHPGGLRTTYEPVLTEVRAGDRVATGTPVGRVAATPGHCLPVTCLHWGLRTGPALEGYRDPLSLLGRLPVRLLPVWAAGPLTALPVTGPVPLTAPPAPDAARRLASRPGLRSPPADRGPLMAGGR